MQQASGALSEQSFHEGQQKAMNEIYNAEQAASAKRLNAVEFDDRNLELEEKIRKWVRSWIDDNYLPFAFCFQTGDFVSKRQIAHLAKSSLPRERDAIRRVLETEPYGIRHMGTDADRFISFIMEEKAGISLTSPGVQPIGRRTQQQQQESAAIKNAMRFNNRDLHFETIIRNWIQSWIVDNIHYFDFLPAPEYVFPRGLIIDLARPSLPCESDAIREILERVPAAKNIEKDADKFICFIMEEKVRISHMLSSVQPIDRKTQQE